MKAFLFQGDSITDSERSRQYDFWLGHGYPTMTAGALHRKNPGRFHFMNRAISGDKSSDLYARVKEDVIDLKPDYMSVLIGVNDVWHGMEGWGEACSAEQFEQNCRRFYTQVLAALPDITIFVLEPFVAEGTVYAGERWIEFRRAVEKNAAAARKLTDELGLIYVPLQQRIDTCVERLGAEIVTMEGVHPTDVGHSVIAAALLEAVEKELASTET